MDTLDNYRRIIKEVLIPYTEIPYTFGVVECKAVFDTERDSYLLMSVGWENSQRVHYCMVHVDIIHNKIWVQRDRTEDGVTYELEAAGIPKDKIVLAFQPEDIRHYTEYAVA